MNLSPIDDGTTWDGMSVGVRGFNTRGITGFGVWELGSPTLQESALGLARDLGVKSSRKPSTLNPKPKNPKP